MHYFSSAEPDNLGMVQIIEIDTMTKISDSTYIQIARYNDYRRVDTIYDPRLSDTTYTSEQWKEDNPRTTLLGFDTSSTNSPAMDSIIKHKEKINSRNKNNEITPLIENESTPPNAPTSSLFTYFIFALFGLMVFMGTFIWMTNRKKITVN